MLAPSSLKRKRQPKVEIARRKQEDRERLFSASQAIEDASPSVAGSSKLDDDEDAGKRRSIAKVVEIALWSWTFDPNDLSIEGEAPDTFTPLQEVVRLTGLNLKTTPAAEVIQAIRSYGQETLELRLDLSLQGEAGPSAGAGLMGYEIRVKGVRKVEKGDIEEERLVHLESIPPAHQSLSSLHHLLTNPSPNSSSSSRSLPIQALIPLQPSHKSLPSYECVFILFPTRKGAKRCLKGLGWYDEVEMGKKEGLGGEEAVEGRRWLRGCSFERFKALKEEYLEYQAECLKRRQIIIAANQPSQPPSSTNNHTPPEVPKPSTSLPSTLTNNSSLPGSSAPPPHQPTPKPTFPPHRLLFIRNLPPDTNKTAIKNEVGGVMEGESGVAVDYVDWVKGSDSAHVRLSKPITPQHLSGFEGKGWIVELVGGKREELYWMRLPEKILQAAMAAQ